MKGSHAIGVDVGGTKILAGVVDREGNVERRHERPTPTESQDALLAARSGRGGRAVSSVNILLAGITGGRPLRGSSGAAGELGHMGIVHDGRPCQGTCTGRGNLEPYVTGVEFEAPDAAA